MVSQSRPQCPGCVWEYIEEVTRRLQVLGCHSVLTTGSLALNAFDAASSDIDLIAVFPDQKHAPPANKWTAALYDENLHCPAAGLELLVYRDSVLQRVPRPLPYLVGLDAGTTYGQNITMRGHYNGGLLDIAICRHSGHTLLGEEPSTLISPIVQDRIKREIVREMRWAMRRAYQPDHDPTGAYAVLTQLRGLYYFQHRKIASKVSAAEWLNDVFGNDVGVLALKAKQSKTPLPQAVFDECRALSKGLLQCGDRTKLDARR